MRVLVLGGTGAIGARVCSRLSELGGEVVSTTRRDRASRDSNVSYAKGDAHDPAFLGPFLAERWDAIVDFMVWSTEEFRERYRGLLSATDQYVYTSSYRVYADSPVIREGSPRLLDVVDDQAYLATDEYALAKARCEDLLFGSGQGNWTVVRPAVTYDGAVGRLQLGVLESGDWLWRAVNGVPVPLPAEMLRKQATMSWSGEVAEMVARLVGNPAALGEAFTVSCSDHMTWGEVAEAYRSALPSLEIVPCDLGGFERAWGNPWQVRYDRMYDRVVDNSKVLAATGLRQSDLTGMKGGLARELGVFLASGRPVGMAGPGFQARFDRMVGGAPSFRGVARYGGPVAVAKYLVRRYVSTK